LKDISLRDRRLMVTPEGVGLHLKLAEAGARLWAFLLDVAIMCAILIVVTLVAGLLLVGSGLDLAAIIWLLGFFLLRNFYFALFELRPRGATPGKRLLGIRVTVRNGGRLTTDAVLARNLTRELEVFLPLSLLSVHGTAADGWLKLLGLGWAGIFLVFPLLNRDRLRVGDLLAGTWVICTPRRRLLPDMAVPSGPGTAFGFTEAQLAVYGIKELHVLEGVLRTRNPEAMAVVASRISGKIGWSGGRGGDEVFLQAFYAALRGRLERGLLFGRRQKDKFDRT
jgi:uncharacterized RDD family membrane protein YckC